jgi:hypothetical protein
MSKDRASQWGRWLAQYLRAQGESNPFLLAAQFGWRVILENNEEKICPLAPTPMAEWDGSRRTIRLFLPTLYRYLGHAPEVLPRACAHELFHGLAAFDYLDLNLHAVKIPALSYREEEMAAHAFSEALSCSEEES